MSTTNLGYIGNVKLKLTIKDKIITIKQKNEGTDYLMKSICKFLTGNTGGTCDIPQMLDLRVSYDDGVTWQSFLNQDIPLSGKQFLQTVDPELGIDTLSWVARFNAAIPAGALLSKITNGDEEDNRQFRFVLYGDMDKTDLNEPYHDLAYIRVETANLARITEGTQALVEWTMQIINVNKEN